MPSWPILFNKCGRKGGEERKRLSYSAMITSDTPFFPIFDLAIIAIAHFATLALITSFLKATSTDKYSLL